MYKKYLLIHNPNTNNLHILVYKRTSTMSGYVDIFNNSKSYILRFMNILKDSDNIEDLIGNRFKLS